MSNSVVVKKKYRSGSLEEVLFDSIWWTRVYCPLQQQNRLAISSPLSSTSFAQYRVPIYAARWSKFHGRRHWQDRGQQFWVGKRGAPAFLKLSAAEALALALLLLLDDSRIAWNSSLPRCFKNGRNSLRNYLRYCPPSPITVVAHALHINPQQHSLKGIPRWLRRRLLAEGAAHNTILVFFVAPCFQSHVVVPNRFKSRS